MSDIIYEKAKGRGGTVNRTSVNVETAVRRFLYKKCYEKFRRIYKKTPVPEISFVNLFCEFYENCRNTFFTEHQRTTASNYSSINNSEGRIGKRNCKL